MLEAEFIHLIKNIIRTETFAATKHHKHHIRGTLYAHSIKVAYLCYLHHKRHALRIPLAEFVQGALLHDYYLYDLHGSGTPHKFHWLRHPRIALQNAERDYPNLTRAQRDMIARHMFPMTLIPPTTLACWLVCFYDKVAAVSDRFGADRWSKIEKELEKNEKDAVSNIS